MSQLPEASPKLSVTVLNYNYGHFLPTCLNSILSQTFKDFELILINDKSTDNSLEMIKPYLADPRVRLVDHVENKGFVRSLIEGCELSRGAYISVISADDWSLDPTAFEKQIATMEKDPEIAYVFTDYGYYHDEQTCTLMRHPAPASYVREGLDVFQDLVLNRTPQHSGTIIRRTAYDAIGGYNPQLQYAVDGQVWLGLCHAGKVAYINEPLYAQRMHGSNMSKKKAVVRKSIQEVLWILDWSFGMLPPDKRRALDPIYKKAVRITLSEYVFITIHQDNDVRLGWAYFWAAMKIRPVETLFQKTIIVLIARTMLGNRGYQFLIRAKAMLSGRSRAHLAA